MYALVNTFLNERISRHRTLRAACIAQTKVGRHLSAGSYIPTNIEHDDGTPLTEEEQDELRNIDPYNVGSFNERPRRR